MDHPSVPSEEQSDSSNVDLEYIAADDRIWGHIVDLGDGWSATWAFLALGESCCSYAT